MTLELIKDYFKRVKIRRKIINEYFKEEDYADIIRECQETVELALKGILLYYGIKYPKIHDVGKVFKENKNKFPDFIKKEISNISLISKNLRRDREISFYGDFDIIPLKYYEKEDAIEAIKNLDIIIALIEKIEKGF